MMFFSRHIRNQLLHKKLSGEDVKGSIWQNAINTFAAFSTVRQDVVADGMHFIFRCS